MSQPTDMTQNSAGTIRTARDVPTELKDSYPAICAGCGKESRVKPSIAMLKGQNDGHIACNRCYSFLHLVIDADGERMNTRLWEDYLSDLRQGGERPEGHRFTVMPVPPEGYEADERTIWWYDTWRTLDDPNQPYMAVQTYANKDANDYVPVKRLHLVFQDQAEYYAVCGNCRAIYGSTQWSGSTRGGANWRERAEEFLAKHQGEKGWCQFCDPIFGFGGWRLD
jgi:hypothetical protein